MNGGSQKPEEPELVLVPEVVVLVPALAHPLPADRHPVAVYLARLASGSRRRMGQALQIIAALFGCTPETLDWSQLRYQHTQGIRTRLAESPSAAGANKMLAALRGVLEEAWRLGLMTAEDYHGATDLPGVRGERLPRGRALSRRELQRLFAACANDATDIGRRGAAPTDVQNAIYCQ